MSKTIPVPTLINTAKLPMRRLPNGMWQLRKRLGNGKRVEIALGTDDHNIAFARAQQIIGSHSASVIAASWEESVEAGLNHRGWLRAMYKLLRYRNGQKKWPEPLTIEQLAMVARRSGGLCEVSGIQFVMGGTGRHPFKPSVDRIDSALPYTFENVRFVCLAVNFCMGQWGEAVFRKIAAATVSKYLEKMAAVEISSAENGENSNKGGRPKKTVSN